MTFVYHRFDAGEQIPVDQYLKNRKLKKYFNGETSAAVLCVGELIAKTKVDPAKTAMYYATGLLEYEDYGLADIVANSVDEQHAYSPKLFIERGLSNVSPLSQFKVLHNMPLSFISIAYGFTADNSSLYSASVGLISTALAAPDSYAIIIGSGKTYRDGSVESGFALLDKKEINSLQLDSPNEEAVMLFRRLAHGQNTL
jgi:hypothetical protein